MARSLPLRLLDCFGFTNPPFATGATVTTLDEANLFLAAFFELIVDVEDVSSGELRKAEGDDMVMVSIDA